MGGSKSIPKTKPTRMPIENDKAALEAKRRRAAELQAMMGRAATALVPENETDKLGIE